MTEAGSPGRESEPQPIAERYLELLQTGTPPSADELLREHPDATGALARRLSLLRLLHRAAAGSQASARPGTALPGSPFRIRCPHCGQLVEVAPGSPPPGPAGGSGTAPPNDEVVCSACGGSFRLDLEGGGAARAEDVPAQIGKFRVLSLLGRGSFGAVYKAQDTELGRLVAIKLPRASLHASREEEERFLREARSAALLRHPGIVQVYEVAEERGVPYIVSEYIEGKNLADRIAGGTPKHRESAELTARIADALHFAHQARIIHRDIKPGNILLDAAGRPHLADFGLARHDEDKVTVTVEGQVIGTPAYMSPEQASGDMRKVDARSDVYSVGAVLYELLTGERPFRGSRAQLLNQVLHDEPRRPRAWSDRIPRDLETICLKAMAREPARRYGTAGELAADLRRFLDGRPVLARPVGRHERLWRWVRRNPMVASLVGAVAVLLLTVAAVSSAMVFRTARARDEANERLSRLNVATGFRQAAEGDFLGALPWFAEAQRLDERRQGRDEIHRIRFERLALALSEAHAGLVARAHRLEHHPGLVPSRRGKHPDRQRRARAHRRGRRGGVGAALAAGGHHQRRLQPRWPARPHLRQGRSRPPLGRRERRAAGGATPPSGSGLPRRVQRRWTAHRLLVQRPHGPRLACELGEAASPPLEHGGEVWFASFDPTGDRVVTASTDGTASVWDVSSGSRIGKPLQHRGPVNQAVFSPDGTKVATASEDYRAALWDAATGEPLMRPLAHGNDVVAVSFSRDGLRLLTACYDSTANVWDVVTGSKLLTLRHSLGVPTAVYSPEGRRILTSSFDGTARIWDAATGAPLSPPLHNSGVLHFAAFSPEGRRVLTASNDDTLRLWDLAGGERPFGPLRHLGWISHAELSPDGTRILVTTAMGAAQLWDARSGEPAAPMVFQDGGIAHASFSPDGTSFVTCGGGSVRRWEARTGKPMGGPMAHPRAVKRVAFDPGGRRIATACDDGAVRVWDAASGQPVGMDLGHPGAPSSIAFTPDGRRLLTGCADGAARIWDLEEGKVVVGPMQHSGPIVEAWVSADGGRVATASKDRTGRVWDARTGVALTAPLEHDSSLTSIEISRDGRRVVTTSYDATARVWDAATGAPVTPPLKHRGVVLHAAFSADDRLVVTASSDTTAIVWDAETGEQVTPAFQHKSGVSHAAFSPDGQRLLTAGADGGAALWALPSSRRPFEEEALLSSLVSGRRIDATGGFVRLPARDFEAAWRRLSGTHREYFVPSTADILAWHDREAAECEDARDWARVAEHLTKVLEVRPGDGRIRLRRGNANGWLGRFAEAAGDFAVAIEQGAGDPSVFHSLALARLESGDSPGFGRSGEDMVSRYRDAEDAFTANELAWHLTVVPGTFPDFAVPLAAAERAVAASPRNVGYRNTLGAARYRAGDLERAVGDLEESIKLQGAGGGVFDWLFLAMAHRRLGHGEVAADFLAKGRAWAARLAQQRLDKPLMSNWSQPIEVRALLAEAEAVPASR